MTGVTTAGSETIRSEFYQFPSRSGNTIAAYLDYPVASGDPPQVIVMSPKYGESKKNNLQLAYHLAANGFTVLRFDFTCHFGESEGSMLDFTLPNSVEDIFAVGDFVERQLGISEFTLIASSLSALPAFRATAGDQRIKHLIGIVPVMDFADTIFKVYREDLIGDYVKGRRFGVLDILGHDVNMDHFCEVTIGANMHNLDGTLAALKAVKCPVTLLPAESDAWVSLEDVERVASCNSRIKVRPIEGAMHEVRESKAAAERLIHEVLTVCRLHTFGEEAGEILRPDKKLVFAQNRVERERLRAARPSEENEDAFWSKYLGKYRIMEKMGDYQQYLDLVGAQLGEFADGEILLDAGCGNGLLGVWVLRELLERKKRVYKVPPVYLGIDLTESGLSDAMEKHVAAESMLEPGAASHRPGLVYARTDLDVFSVADESFQDVVRFKENTFHKIVCSLLLSYLKDPPKLLETLYRQLRPGGRIVISSMKPFCDLSAIYRDFVEEKAERKDIHSARELLRAAGAIKIKEEQGYYDFFSEKELVKMLERAGFRKAQCFSSLGNQANVAVATK